MCPAPLYMSHPFARTRRAGAREPLPPLLQFRGVVLYPAQDRRVGQVDAPLGQHGHQIAIAELETQVPAHAQHHDLLTEMATLEQFLQRSKLLHRSIIAVFAPEPSGPWPPPCAQ